MKKVLFLDTVHPILMEMLQGHGFSCEKDYESTYDQIRNKLSDYNGIVIRSRIPMDRALIAANPQLEFIARSGAGLENIDLEAAKEFGIDIISSPEGNMDAVGEHAIGMLLILFNKLASADAEVRQGIWRREENRGLELAGKTVGIIGFGNMGRCFAKKLQGFDCNIMAYDKYKSQYAPDYVTETNLETLKNSADIISIHLPLSSETNYYVDSDFIGSVTKPFYLINTARGNNVCIQDLAIGLDSGKVLGACLDVLEYEKKSLQGLDFEAFPLPLKSLMKNGNVVFSPHVAGWTHESYVKLSKVLGDKILEKYN